MAYYALLNKNNIVTRVISGKDQEDVDYDMELVYQNMFFQTCKRTSYNTIGGVHYNQNVSPKEISSDQTKAFRKNYAGVGFTYDESRDAFIPPKPYNKWILNEDSCLWEPPVERPTDDNRYEWSDDSENWEKINP